MQKRRAVIIREVINIIFELIAFFIMFRHQDTASSHDFFVEQFLFVMPYLVDFIFTQVKIKRIHYKLTWLFKIDDGLNGILAVILAITIVLGLGSYIGLAAHALNFLSISIPLNLICYVEFLIILNIIAFNYKIKKL